MDQRQTAAEIRAELGRQNLSQADLARAAGFSEVYISRRLTGQVKLSLGDIIAIASVLRVPRAQFLEPNRRAS